MAHKQPITFKTRPYVVRTENAESLSRDDARGIAVTSFTQRASVRWKPSKRDRVKTGLPSALDGIAYMPRAVVTGSGKPPRKRKQANPVITTKLSYADRVARYGITNGGNADA